VHTDEIGFKKIKRIILTVRYIAAYQGAGVMHNVVLCWRKIASLSAMQNMEAKIEEKRQ
jgi:hypothetical protein